MGAVDERLAGEAAVEGGLLRGPDEAALRLPHPRGGYPQCGGAAQSKIETFSNNENMRQLRIVIASMGVNEPVR